MNWTALPDVTDRLLSQDGICSVKLLVSWLVV